MKNILVLYKQGNKEYWKNQYKHLDVNSTIFLNTSREGWEDSIRGMRFLRIYIEGSVSYEDTLKAYERLVEEGIYEKVNNYTPDSDPIRLRSN